jgi:serine/threonine protein kinase
MPSLWPTQIEYQDAVTFPAYCFTDPVLRSASVVEKTPFGLPLPITGQFASVYRLRPAENSGAENHGDVAVRLFLRSVEDRTERWNALTSHVAALSSPPAGFVPFTYQEQGIRVAGRLYPLVTMPYIESVDLARFLETNLYSGAVLRDTAAAFRQTVLEWEAAGIAHGDLQHGNILVEPSGTLRFVDYDGAFVAALAGRHSPEMGHPSYQHPQRTATDFGPAIDRFPALVIYTALRSLAVAPELWYRLDNGDNLLFRREDFADTKNSRAFTTMLETLRPFPPERRLLTALRDVCVGKMSSVPPIDRVE